MHDPLTVAFEIEWPIHITIWHKDPEKDGTDSSCMHRIWYRKLNSREKALSQFIYDGEIIFDNRPHYPNSREHFWYQELKILRREWRARRTPYIPWQCHFWHWRLQIHCLQKLWRWLFKRCAVCGKRLGYNESAIGSWSGDAIWHQKCDKSFIKTLNNG